MDAGLLVFYGLRLLPVSEDFSQDHNNVFILSITIICLHLKHSYSWYHA